MNILELNNMLQEHKIVLISNSSNTFVYMNALSGAEYIVCVLDTQNISHSVIKQFETLTGLSLLG